MENLILKSRPLPGMEVVECARRPCLFNIVDDPSEHKDLAAVLPRVVTKLWARFNESNAAHHPAKLSPPRDVQQDNPGASVPLHEVSLLPT